jgi:hypothetical protein
MSFSDILKPRNEVLKGDGIQGIIDLENLRNTKRKTLEASPKEFFELTYPTSDIKYVLEKLNERYNSSSQTAGLFLLEGFKGSGKSHLELLIYYLLSSPEFANQWLSKYNIKCTLPNDILVLINKFTDFPTDFIWKVVFEKLGVSDLLNGDELPNLDQLRNALRGRKIAIILDELEIGFESINRNYQAKNLSFLQMLSEEALRTEDSSITIFASVYNSNKEPGSTLKRVPRVEIKFSEPQDRKMVVLHRIFSNYQSHDKSKVEVVVQSYLNQWKKNEVRIDEKYADSFIESYPFTPEVIDMLFNRVLVKDFQGNRGPLSLLGRVVQLTADKEDIVSTAYFDFKDKKIRNYLLDLDTNQTLLQCAQNDYRDLQTIKMSNEIINSTLISTLCTSGTVRGIKDFELARQVLKPGDDYNEFQASLSTFVKFGAYFHQSEDSFYFDTQEKPFAKVEYRSLRIPREDALNFALERWSTHIFNDSSSTVLRDTAQVKSDLLKLDKNSPRFILSPKRLQNAERKELYHGIENQNLVILMEPKSDAFNIYENHDVIKWAQLSLAARDLKSSASDYDRKRQYERIELDNQKYVDESFKRAGLAYAMLREIDGKIDFELESVGNANQKNEVIEYLKKNFYPRMVFEEHLQKGIEQFRETGKGWVFNQPIKDLKNIYKKTLSFPILLAETNLIDAIKKLCLNKQVGLSHPRENFCGIHPNYSGSEWDDVEIIEPFLDDKADEGIGFPVRTERPAEKNLDDLNILTINSGQSNVPLGTEPLNITTPNFKSIGELRQDIALRLNEKENAIIDNIRFTIFLEKTSVEISTLPSSLRGALSGQGDLNFELNIIKNGSFSKSQAEQLAEQLPSFQDAVYKATLKGFIKKEEPVNEK